MNKERNFVYVCVCEKPYFSNLICNLLERPKWCNFISRKKKETIHEGAHRTCMSVVLRCMRVMQEHTTHMKSLNCCMRGRKRLLQWPCVGLRFQRSFLQLSNFETVQLRWKWGHPLRTIQGALSFKYFCSNSVFVLRIEVNEWAHNLCRLQRKRLIIKCAVLWNVSL